MVWQIAMDKYQSIVGSNPIRLIFFFWRPSGYTRYFGSPEWLLISNHDSLDGRADYFGQVSFVYGFKSHKVAIFVLGSLVDIYFWLLWSSFLGGPDSTDGRVGYSILYGFEWYWLFTIAWGGLVVMYIGNIGKMFSRSPDSSDGREN